MRDRWNPGIDAAAAVPGRADSGDIEIDLVEVLTDIGGLAAERGRGVAVFIDGMQDLGADDVSALCAAALRNLPKTDSPSWSGPGCRTSSGCCQRVQVLLREAFSLLPNRPPRPRGRQIAHL